MNTPNALDVTGLTVEYGHGASRVRVLNEIDVVLASGTTLGVVGESGSGKSTLAKALVGSVTPTGGTIHVNGSSATGLRGRELMSLRRRVQLIPQDPYSSLNPRRTIGHALAESIDPKRARVRENQDLIVDWLERVRLSPDAIAKYPHEFSGGQRQRVAIARALIISPELVIADEITSALDVSVQRDVLDLLRSIRDELAVSMIFISHNLAVVRQVSDRVLVLYRGDVVEEAPVDELFLAPQAAYTRELLAAVPGSPTFALN